MNSNRSEERDERNGGFGLPAGAMEKTKPGLAAEDRDPAMATQSGDAEGHDRFVNREKKEVPDKPLAERIGKTTKGY